MKKETHCLFWLLTVCAGKGRQGEGAGHILIKSYVHVVLSLSVKIPILWRQVYKHEGFCLINLLIV